MACLLLILKWLACVLAGKAFANVHARLCFWSTVLWLLPGFPQHVSFQQLGWGNTCIDEHLVRDAVVDIPVYVHTERMATGPREWAALNKRWAHLVEEEHSANWFSWPLWLPLAELLVCRKWPVDVTTVVLRNTTKSWKPPLLPPRSLLLSMLRSVQPQEPYHWQQHATAAKSFFQSSTMSTVAPAYDSRHLYDSRQVVAVVRASRHCRSLKEAVKPETISDLGLLVSAHFWKARSFEPGSGPGPGLESARRKGNTVCSPTFGCLCYVGTPCAVQVSAHFSLFGI